MKVKTKVLIMTVIAIFAMLLMGATKVEATDVNDEEGKYCMFTLHKANGEEIEVLGSRR